MKRYDFNKVVENLVSTDKMPVLFLGHGSPMNAMEDNEFTAGWKNMARELPKPKVILCISAHWETQGTYVTAMETPQTIHDFSGFPQALYDVNYPAPGSPAMANETKSIIHKTEVQLDNKWGLDHGAWSVMRQMYPEADIPLIQMSLDYKKNPSYHYDLAQELVTLRSKGVLIVGSGNMVHNLRVLNWHNPDESYDWALEANAKMKTLILNNDHAQLINYTKLGKSVELSVPTPEHFLPLLYALALKDKDESVSIFNDKTIMGSISMTSLKIG